MGVSRRLWLELMVKHDEHFPAFPGFHLPRDPEGSVLPPKVSPDGNLPPPGVSAPSRVAAVGPYIQSSTMPRMPSRPELLVKPALPDGPLAMQPAEGPMKVHTLPNMRSGAAAQTKGKARHTHVLPQRLLPNSLLCFPSGSFITTSSYICSCSDSKNPLYSLLGDRVLSPE